MRRSGDVEIWIAQNPSAGAECASHRFPELVQASACLPEDTVLEGEIFPPAAVAKRLAKGKPAARTIQTSPVSFMAWDLARVRDEDIRTYFLAKRLALLRGALPANSAYLKVPEPLSPSDWAEIDVLYRGCRKSLAEGLWLRHETDGRNLRWKSPPLSIDAVLIYVETGTDGIRSYNFALWDEDTLIPMARAPVTSLAAARREELDQWVRENVRDRFGPVRSVDPIQVFELAFDEIEASPRHRSGLSLRSPRIVRWKKEAHPRQAGSLQNLRKLLEPPSLNSRNAQ